MRKFSKVEQAYVGTTDASSRSLIKTQSSTSADLSWLLIQIVIRWGDCGQVGTGRIQVNIIGCTACSVVGLLLFNCHL